MKKISNLLKLFRYNKVSTNYKGSAQQVGFIIGTGRCGTTILSKVLNSHSRICVPHELQIVLGVENGDRFYEKYISGELKKFKAKDCINLIERRCPYKFDEFFDYKNHFKSLSYPQADLMDLLQNLFDHICFANGKSIFIEQTPWYGQRLNILKEIFPNMKIIHVVRDGRDVALSFAKSPWWSNDVETNMLQWEKEVKLIHSFGIKYPENFVEIKYEDLVQNTEHELKKVLQLFGLEYEADILNPDKLINYDKFLKGDNSKNVSKEYKDWSSSKKQVFSQEVLTHGKIMT
ncbi:MAG: sulfotransferase [bacterium]|nr:sulfotransferase [bacterium]